MLGPGDVIGRSDVAAMCLDDPRVSEAHAMISLRDRALKLIGLRGWFKHGDEVCQELELTPGLRVELAPGVELECEEVTLPTHLIGLELPGGLVVTLVKTMTLSIDAGRPALRGGFDPDSDAVFWSVGSRWRARIGDAESIDLTPGDTLSWGDVHVEVVAVPLSSGSHTQTKSRLRLPLTLTITRGRVLVERADTEPMLISGVPGRLLASVLSRGGSAGWEEVIEDVWPDDASTRSALRRRFDTGLRRLRDTLRHALPGQDDLVSLDGTGVLVANLRDEDRLVNEP